MSLPKGLPRLWPAVFLVAALGSVAACAQGSSSNYGQSFGTLSLAAGQRQQVWMGASYRLVRVCNDFHSAGTVTAVIDDQPAVTLPPGRCDEDWGNQRPFHQQRRRGGDGHIPIHRRPVLALNPSV